MTLKKKLQMWRKKPPCLKSRGMECMTTKSTPVMSMIVCQNCKTSYRRGKTGLLEATYE